MKRPVNYLLYGVGSLGNGIFAVVPGFLLMFYMTNILGIAVSLAAAAVFVPRAVDVLADPLIGHLSDRTSSRWGRRRPYMLLGAIVVGPAFAFLFSTPEVSSAASFWIVLACFIVATLAYTVFMVPYVTLTSEIPEHPNERTIINSYRVAYAMAGVLAGGACGPVLIDLGGGGRGGYATMGWVLGAVVTSVMLISVWSAREPKLKSVQQVGVKQLLPILASGPGFALLLGAYVLQLAAAGLMGAVLPYFSVYVLHGSNSTMALMFLSTYGLAAVSLPLWLWTSKGLSKIHGFMLAAAIYALGTASFAVGGVNQSIAYALLSAAIVGLGVGAQQMFAFSLLADIVMESRDRLQVNTEGAMVGLFIAGEKIGTALGALLGGVLLGVIGLVETTQGFVDQSTGTVGGINIVFAFAPVLLIGMSLLVVRYYGASRPVPAATKTIAVAR